MARDDALRWNTRYQEPGRMKQFEPRDLLIRFNNLFHPGALVLDMAMGLGVNAKFLVEKGCRVVGVDISNVAVHIANQNCQSIMKVIADSAHINFPENAFDAILNFYFLDRKLFYFYEKTLKRGGFLFFETPSVGTDNEANGFPQDYLLERNELLPLYSSWDILYRNRVKIPRAAHGKKIIEKIILRKA